MTGKHLTHEQLTEWIYGESDEDCRTHLTKCSECRERYGELTTTLDWIKRLPVPEQSASEKTATFVTAWQSANVSKGTRSQGFLWPLLRHAASFGFGLACGMLILIMTLSPFEAKGGQASPQSEINKPKSPVPDMLQGTPAAQVYLQLENPVIVVHKEGSSNKPIQRVLEGTAENGKIQIIWNL